MALSNTERTWLKTLFQQYYSKTPIVPPYDVSKREFGYGLIKKIDTRHVSFADNKEFNHFLQNVSPLFVSASSAEYSSPGAQPISTKGLLGSDLIYEFDADDLQTDCKQIHDSWSCPACGASGKGRVLKCTSCAKGTVMREWTCDTCVGATKIQTIRLLNVLQDDFGFEEKDFLINFSGSKGYHIHIRSPKVYELPKSARIELMDYLSLHEFDPELAGFSYDGKLFRCPKYERASGHAKRLLDEIISLLKNANETDWAIISGSSPRSMRSFLEHREEWVKDVYNGVLPPLSGKKTEAFWKTILASLADKIRFQIDRQTSGDIVKLVRVPNTLHGSTGLIAKIVPFSQLLEFDPFTHAVAFSPQKERKLLVHSSPLLRIGSQTLDPISEKEIMVSEALAAFLVGWSAAELR